MISLGDFRWFVISVFCESVLFESLVNAKTHFIAKNKQ